MSPTNAAGAAPPSDPPIQALDPPGRQPPARSSRRALARWLGPLASLRLTVVLLVMSMVLVFAGTFGQIDHDIWLVQHQYFHTWLTWISLRLFLPRMWDVPAVIGLPMLGGYSLGVLILANLVSAHLVHFKLSWKRIGVILIHLGLILLVIGEIWSSVTRLETRMVISEGQTVNWSMDLREIELAIIDRTSPDADTVTAIPGWMLFKHRTDTIRDPRLPEGIELRVDDIYANSTLIGPNEAKQWNLSTRANAGPGASIAAMDLPRATGVDSGLNLPSAYITVLHNGSELGTYLVSVIEAGLPGMARVSDPQPVQIGDKTLELQLRFRRYYKPYWIQLLDFNHERYPGTDVPKDFSSYVRLINTNTGEDRQVRIWMNHPLLYNGETIYQAGYDGDHTTILQVVRNPAWVMPYAACLVGGLGMVVHFGMHLLTFLGKRNPRRLRTPSAGTLSAGVSGQTSYTLEPRPAFSLWAILLPIIAGGLSVLMMLNAARPAKITGEMDLETFGKLPISFQGRIQPLDTVARDSLALLSKRETLRNEAGEKVPAIRWLADVMSGLHEARTYRVFRIDNPDVIGALQLDQKRKYFSFDEIWAQHQELGRQFSLAVRISGNERNRFQRSVVALGEKVNRFSELSQMEWLFLVPPPERGGDWQPLGPLRDAQGQLREDLTLVQKAWTSMHDTYIHGDAENFNRVVQMYYSAVRDHLPREMSRIDWETFFRHVDPYFQCLILYLLASVLASVSWMVWSTPLRRATMAILAVALIAHTLALVARIYISGRPPVTNLASSAMLIAWGSVALAMAIEWFYRNGVGSAAAGVIGYCSLMIARQLSLGMDDMQVLQAVLDTNFWLTTHVIAITLGYSAAFLAGAMGNYYVLAGVFTTKLRDQAGKSLVRMTYGVLCFAMLLSFVGTLLGGIWADQSWGRFWGWDPKENGAMLLVLWIAVILHARWAGLARDRGVMLLSIGTGIVTSWSWFGTNMLGIGLHSYGFMDAAMIRLLAFIVSQLFIIGLGLMPLANWRSFRSDDGLSGSSAQLAL